MIDVTIVVPVYNAEQYLPDLFVSLSNQTYQGYRAIIVDDCSTDSSYETATCLARPLGERIIVLKNARNSGQGTSRNIGLDVAAKSPTKYVTFLDADDWFEPRYLEDLHTMAEEQDADLTISGIIRFDDKTEKVLCSEMVNYPIALFENSANCDDLGQINTCPYAKLFRFEPILDLRFRIAKRSEDTCYMFEALPHLKRIAFTNHAYYHYRVREGSVTGVMGWETVESMHKLFSDTYRTFLSGEGASYRELFESQVYLRSSVGGVLRASFADLAKTWKYSMNELTWLDSAMPTWRNNKYLSFNGWRSKTAKQLAVKMSASFYKAHAFPLFVYLYYFISIVLKKEIRV